MLQVFDGLILFFLLDLEFESSSSISKFEFPNLVITNVRTYFSPCSVFLCLFIYLLFTNHLKVTPSLLELSESVSYVEQETINNMHGPALRREPGGWTTVTSSAKGCAANMCREQRMGPHLGGSEARWWSGPGIMGCLLEKPVLELSLEGQRDISQAEMQGAERTYRKDVGRMSCAGRT